MALLPKPINHTADAIYGAYAKARGQSWDAMGISVSILGRECERALWYEFRWTSPLEIIDGPKAITFETGDIEEQRLLGALRMIGCEVIDHDERGKQVRVSSVAGHVRGKIDGKVLGLPEAPKTWHIVECKSMKETYWNAVVKKGVREGYYDHWVQLNIYCHLLGFDRGFYICRNKNTGLVHCERIETDHAEAIRLLARAERIVKMAEPPPKLFSDPTKKVAFKCGYCRHKGVCHYKEFARVNCRTCLHSSPVMVGEAMWSCVRHNKPLTLDEQKRGCGSHLYIPALVPGELVDTNEDAELVFYTLHDGRQWCDGEKQPDPIPENETPNEED
jgi:hypothetical protein